MAFFFALFLPLFQSSPFAEWHAMSNGFPVTISISQQGDKYIGHTSNADDECKRRLDNVMWDAESGILEWRMTVPGVTQWYKVSIADGIMTGRFSHENVSKGAKPIDPLAYKYSMSGWSQGYFPITPAVFDIKANGFRGRVRIDKSGDQFIGRLKMYAFENQLLESLEEDITINQWDGEALIFTRGIPQVYTGATNGRYISGKFTHAGFEYQWSGSRAEVLTYGLTPKSPEESVAWQERTRRTLYRLMMGGNPQPLSVNVEIIANDLPPISSPPYPLRDDNPGAHPQNYTRTELRLTYTLPNRLGGAPISRTVHAYLAKPTTPPPNGLGKYPLLVAVNGHNGSAYQMLDPGSLFYYGDSFARRGYMVLAVDISHRPLADRFGYTLFVENGDDPAHGNGLHPAIKAPGDTTDWEEDGERVWDVMRALDYALSRSDVDSQRIVTTGLSMGGEIASYVGALDPRIGVTIPAGYSPDLSVVKYHGNHECYTWRSDIREYIDQSDVLSLIAPRALIVETGKLDAVFSAFTPPFAGDKQVLRRARIAGGSVVHFLHSLIHEWRGGGVMFATVIEPIAPGDQSWQTNGDTATDGRTLFDYVAEFLNF
jgi:Dienelactone hydrolase family